MERINSLEELDKPIKEYDYAQSAYISREEKEITVNLYFDNDNNGKAKIYSSYRPGIRWCIARVAEGVAELNNLILEEGKITSISVTTTPALVSLKSKPRKDQYVGATVTI